MTEYRTSRLNAVNTILIKSGSSPINSLTPGTPETQIAEHLLAAGRARGRHDGPDQYDSAVGAAIIPAVEGLGE